MLDTLIVAVVLCVDTCTWGLKEKFEYAGLQFDLRCGITQKVREIRNNTSDKISFWWHIKDTIVFIKED